MAGKATGSTSAVSLGTFSTALTSNVEKAPSGIIATIVGVAQSIAKQRGFSAAQTTELERTSVATSNVETEGTFNPSIVGDHGTSFGLFQLHQGGELGTLTEAQADNPFTNASVAIGHIADVLAGAGNEDPGTVAAAAQRPGDPVGYAADVNSLLSPGGGGAVSAIPNTKAVTAAAGSSGNGAASSGSSSDLTGILAKIGGFAAGLLLVGIGLVILFKGANASAPAPVKDAEKGAAVAAA